jgi:ABC-type molybdate transport system substrate-binding protein
VEIHLPEDLQVTARYPIAVGTGRNRAGGEAFVAFVESATAQQILAKWGFLTLAVQ